MLKIIRESAIERPWFYRGLMILIAMAFVVTMGWWGFEQNKEDVIIRVGEDKVSRDEYLRVYQNMYRFYKEIVPGDIPEDQLKQQVIDQLIESRLWMQAAKDMGVTVTPTELRDSIMRVPSFQIKGKFDPEQYKRVLAANRLTPAMFEASQRADLMREKARALVRESVAPTSSELAEALVAMAGQPMPAMPMEAAVSPAERGQQAALAMKQQRAVVAYQEALKAKSKITVRRDLM
jgi:peptidyl-prolyl cis-trans isomerase D